MRNIDRFIGREKELKILKDSIKNREKGVCIYGPRRVGKTTLISVALSDLDSSVVIYYECVKGSYLYNLELLATEASRVLGLSYIRSLRDIFDIFEAIERESRGKHIVVVIDEYPYMRESCQSGVLDSYFQRIIDNMCSNITVIISGSYITVMKEILESDSPLFGRFDRVLNIKPFSYIEASLFYPSLAFRDKIAFYAVFGGYPFSLKMIDEDKSLFENIRDNLLTDGVMVRTTLENVLLTEAGRSGVPQELLSRIGNGRMRYSEIENMMSEDVSGTLDRSLKRLIGMDIIEKISPINRKDDKKKTFYEIKDNLLRFFFSYIVPNRNILIRTRPEEFYSLMIQPSLDTFISKRFEEIVREYFFITAGASALDIGIYWYDDRKKHKNGEFDCVLKLLDNSYKVFEVKNLSKPMSFELYKEERQKMGEIQDLKISSFGFVSPLGFSFDTSAFPDSFLTGEDIYNNDLINYYQR